MYLSHLCRFSFSGLLLKGGLQDKTTGTKEYWSTLEITSLLISVVWLERKEAYFTDYWFSRAIERISYGKFAGMKVIGQFSSCLKAATRKGPLKQLFFWSWINPWNYVWTCMVMLNFNNKELVQKHLVQGISWNCIPGIGINILSVNQFKVLNAFALKSQQRFWRLNPTLVATPRNNLTLRVRTVF